MRDGYGQLHPLPHALHHQHVHAAPAQRPSAAGAANSRNLAFVSQFVEVPEDVVFTVEYSVRAAQMAVYQLLA
jgi:myosin-crossreactive antigen